VGGLSLVLLADPLVGQTRTLLDRLPAAFDSVMARLESWFTGMTGNDKGGGNGGPALSQMVGWTRQALSVTLTVGTGVAVLVVITSYLAVEPQTYRRGILLLVPPRWRSTGDRLLTRLHHDIESWLMGKFLSMFFVVIMTVVGLLILGIPAAIVLGLIAGALTFVPNFGPIASAIPALLLALGEGGLCLTLWVGGLYVLIQVLEGYLVTPLIQRRVVSLPPALLLFGQTLAAVLLGPLGLILAAPLTVMIKSTVLELYVDDGDDSATEDLDEQASDQADDDESGDSDAT
ncbi:MAG: AI-2E family transporter, partial [Planctomycetota bacterium]